ncbi:TlyA family RNA methyltransferase [Caulobacter vibrioides]|uniref:TlyA family RNA methyltransferase n=1 Tax=Caulobacter vibrioides TaxID=155892 RepID=UPI000BB52B38|nr:TlyA family RNA methyltransferase [Caulobacter vibrioides]ATC24256.1 TlyA family RNA methyltransferase [Caulobacter vibrioides]AZH12503.1 TlyA family RNA methyltransferase [Caulobacter vibrioides]PLR08264.1 TlyA family RNA methyltransferase [Caulobacter vibrioides]
MARKRIDQLLVDRGVFDSRAKARAAIEAGRVSVAGRVVAKPSEQVDEDAEIAAEAAHPWVGRGALKLVHALDTWPIAVEGRVAIDVGASTGGFTEVLLSRGAAFVFAVDVGRDQLHPSLRASDRVADLSGVDARSLDDDRIAQPPGLIVSDVSFISLTKALPAALHLATRGAELVALIKPQFEAGREHVGKGGLVKDPDVIARVEREIVAFLEAAGWSVRGLAESPITGGEGQIERLVWATKL